MGSELLCRNEFPSMPGVKVSPKTKNTRGLHDLSLRFSRAFGEAGKVVSGTFPPSHTWWGSHSPLGRPLPGKSTFFIPLISQALFGLLTSNLVILESLVNETETRRKCVLLLMSYFFASGMFIFNKGFWKQGFKTKQWVRRNILQPYLSVYVSFMNQ